MYKIIFVPFFFFSAHNVNKLTTLSTLSVVFYVSDMSYAQENHSLCRIVLRIDFSFRVEIRNFCFHSFQELLLKMTWQGRSTEMLGANHIVLN